MPATMWCTVGLTTTTKITSTATTCITTTSTGFAFFRLNLCSLLILTAVIRVTSLTSTTSASDFRTVRLFPVRILITPNSEMPFSAKNATFNFRLSARLTFRFALCCTLLLSRCPLFTQLNTPPRASAIKSASLAIASRFSNAFGFKQFHTSSLKKLITRLKIAHGLKRFLYLRHSQPFI